MGRFNGIMRRGPEKPSPFLSEENLSVPHSDVSVKEDCLLAFRTFACPATVFSVSPFLSSWYSSWCSAQSLPAQKFCHRGGARPRAGAGEESPRGWLGFGGFMALPGELPKEEESYSGQPYALAGRLQGKDAASLPSPFAPARRV